MTQHKLNPNQTQPTLKSIDQIINDAKTGDIVRIVLRDREVCGYLRFVSKWSEGLYKIIIDGPYSNGASKNREEFMPNHSAHPYGVYGDATFGYTIREEIPESDYKSDPIQWAKNEEETKSILGYEILLRKSRR